MIGKSAIVWIALACTASGILYQTSYRVQEQEERLSRLNRQIVAEQEAIQVLKAEWAYLNDPDRLEKLVAEHLVLQPTKAEQIVTLDQIPLKTPALVAEAPLPSGRKPASSQVAENHARSAPATSAAATATAAPGKEAGRTAAPVVKVQYGAAR
ncbi:cell division protein FtsL [Oleisolibacter albus]|uniref:cell division protein FtsL n=1 Tax=Oleisolibacter albus TaxID=2171757 RepID=UPI000DF28741|nr:hypothetical protein [Oleisolibacter albus]